MVLWLSSGNCQDSKRTWTWKIFLLGPAWWQKPAGLMHHNFFVGFQHIVPFRFSGKDWWTFDESHSEKELGIGSSWYRMIPFGRREGWSTKCSIFHYLRCSTKMGFKNPPPKKHPALHVHVSVLQYADLESETFPSKCLVRLNDSQIIVLKGHGVFTIAVKRFLFSSKKPAQRIDEFFWAKGVQKPWCCM